VTPRSALPFALWLGIGIAAMLTAGCGGSSSPAALTTPAPSFTPIVSGGQFVASGSKGVTFTFAIGAGVPPGETAVVSALPTPQPCTGPACTAVQPPLDGFEISVGPQPLSVGAFASLVLAGVQSPFDVSMVLQDATDGPAFTNFRLIAPTGGQLMIADPASVRPVLTLAPNHLYAISIYSTNVPPS
jgi:hypothetical protein